MTEELTETMRLAMQWLFAPLLVVAALSLLCVRLETLGVFAAIRSAVRKMSVFQRFAAAAFLAVFIVFASEKTNAPNGELRMENVELSQLPSQAAISILHSSFSILHSAPEGAVTNVRWLLRGAFEDAVRLPFPSEDGFPWRGGVATALTVFACGELRPDAATEYFPAPFAVPLSLPPLSRQDAAAPSVFWHASTPSNSLIATWENALYGRDTACPTNFQAEFFADGSFIYRYPDRSEAYPAVLPFDYDCDGLENSIDPDPEVPGPDAHGTNAQWYNTVCSNILVATEATNCVPPVSLSWIEGVNSNAYYFVDVVAANGPAPICFFDASGRMPDDPVVVARTGETCRVPLVIGVEYAVTSSVPFTVSPAYDTIGRTPDYTLKIEPREGGGMTMEPVDIPAGDDLAPYESVCFSVTCEGCAPSASEEDVKISGVFVENETGCRFTSKGSKLTVFRVELQPKIDPPDLDYASVNRHTYGVCELVDRIQVPSQPVMTWDFIGGGDVVYDEEIGRYYYRCPLNGCQNPIRAGYCGVTYIPSITILEPNSIIAELRYGMTMASVFTTNTVTLGMAGGIGVKLKLYVTPFRVSFSGIAVQEVVSFTYEAEGYFLNPYFNGAFAHTGGIGGAGAGRWGDVQDDNFYAFDTAAYVDRIPWLTPDGHVTNDVAFTWTSGYVSIDNPFGWNLKGTSGTTSPFKRFGEEIHGEFMLFTDGTVGARKLNKQATRTTNGVIRLNGVLMQ